MKKEYNTEQKKAIIDFFKSNREHHYTVAEVTRAVCENGAGKSTVYRQISHLLETGAIRRFETSDSRRFVYQYADSHEDCDCHYHLKCIKCGRLIHMECSHLDEAKNHISKEHDFIIGCGRSVLYGECVACAEREKQ